MFVSDQRERTKCWQFPYLAVAPGHLRMPEFPLEEQGLSETHWSELRISVTVFSSFFPMKLAAAHAYVRATRTSLAEKD
jgi:hypothetical protein